MLNLVERQDLLGEAIQAFDDHSHTDKNNSPEKVAERINREMESLTLKQNTVARAQINAMMKGHDTTPYDKMLEEINEDKAKLIVRLKGAQTQTLKTAHHELKSTVEKLQQVSASIYKSLTAPDEDFSPHEKQELLAVLVDYITPTGDGIEIVLRSETLRYIKIAPLVKPD